MTKLEKYLQQVDIHINPHLLRFAEQKMDQVMRTSSLEPQKNMVRSSLITHVVSMLERNVQAQETHPKVLGAYDRMLVVAMIGQHDIAEIQLTDIDYAAKNGNSDHERNAKEIAEFDYVTHQVIPHLPLAYRDLSILAANQWLELTSPESLWVRLLDLVDGNCYVLQNFMNRKNGSILRVGEDGPSVVWAMEDAGQHINKMAGKTAEILFKLLAKLEQTQAIELLDFFNTSMMAIYEQTGWMNLMNIATLAKETGYGA